MRRFALAIVVALLTFGASGAYALVLDEPCSTSEQPGRDDGACPPMCVTCGCCAQAAEPMALPAAAVPDAPVSALTPPVPWPPKIASRDILHVPKPRRA